MTDESEPTPQAKHSGDPRTGVVGADGGHEVERSSRAEGRAAAHRAEHNRLLAALPFEEYARLHPRLTPVRIRFKDTLIEPDGTIYDVYFPRTGVVSVIAERQEEGVVEVNSIGPEGLVGVPLLLGGTSTPFRHIVQVEGDAWRLSADAFRQLVEERPAVRRLLLRFAQYVVDQVSQSVACNRLHTLEERCARWLLMTHDRVQGDNFEMTHEFMAQMLGVRRPGVTVALSTLQAEGIVRYRRGRLTVLDRGRLEEASCGCYAITRVAFDRLLG